LKTVSLEVQGVYALTNGYAAAVVARSEVVLEINPDGGEHSVARGFFRASSEDESGRVGELELEKVMFVLTVPDPSLNPLLPYPFHWIHDGATTLNTGLQKILNAWETGTLIKFQYLEDGTNGYKGDGVLTDVTLTSALDAMNTFAVKVQGSDT